MSIQTPRRQNRAQSPTTVDPDNYGRSAPCRSCGHDPADGGWTLVESSGGFGPAMASVECPGCSEIVAFAATHDWTLR